MLPLLEHKSELPALTDRIVESYRKTNLTQHLDHCPLPSYKSVVELIEGLKEIIYPGYRNRNRLHSENVVYYVGGIVDRLHDLLVTTFERAICHGEGNTGQCVPEKRELMERIAHQKAIEFLNQIPDIRLKLALDVEAAYAGDPACKSQDEVIFCYPGLEAVTVYRLAHAIHELQVPLIPRMMTEWAHGKTGIDIHPGAIIGDHFFIDHGTGVVIGGTSVIGNWVKLYQGVTLGAISFKTNEAGELIRTTKRHPTIEDNVVIYANATVLGGRTVIGHGSVIGSSVWLTYSIPPETTILIQKPSLEFKNVVIEQDDWKI